MTNIEALFLQFATRGQCQAILPACKRQWAWFTERLCLHYDLIFVINHISSLVKYAPSTQHMTERVMAACHTISDGHGLTSAAIANIGLTFHHLHSQVPSSPLRTTSPVMTTQALSHTSALPSTMTVITVVCYLSLIKMSTGRTLHYLKLHLFEAAQQCHSGQPSSRCGYPETCLDLNPAWVAITTVWLTQEVHGIFLSFEIRGFSELE